MLKASMIGEGEPCPFLNYTLESALQLRKSTENLGQSSRVAGDYSLRRLGCFFMDSRGWPAERQSPRLPVGDFSQPLIDTGAFQVA
jgi:hypothetical protein